MRGNSGADQLLMVGLSTLATLEERELTRSPIILTSVDTLSNRHLELTVQF